MLQSSCHASFGVMAGMAAGGLRADPMLRAVETDAMMESSFRRLMAAIEEEREQIRNTLQQLQIDRETTAAELDQLREDTEVWCANEKMKIDAEWKRLDRLSEKMADIWPNKTEVLKINCSGTIYEVPRGTLCCIEGSYLAELFDEENSNTIKPDADGFYYLDINPQCFALIVEYLLNRRLRVDAPVPVVPQQQKLNMELLAEAWQLKPFLRENRINPVHKTSLHVQQPGNIIEAMHPGWQLISSQHPLPLANPYYFEVKVLRNPGSGTSGGLAIGVCNRIPQGPEMHSIRLPGSIMYNSGNGIIGDVFEYEYVDKVLGGCELAEESVMGVRHDVMSHSLQWYFNGQLIGVVPFKEECLESMRLLFPVFAMYVPGQQIQVEFRSAHPPAMLTDG